MPEKNATIPDPESAAKHFNPPGNEELAEALDDVSRLLAEQGANRFRVEAYRRAAETVRQLDKPAWQIYFDRGVDGLVQLPGVGQTISRALQQMIRGGRWPLRERLRGNAVAEQLFASVPNIGPVLARKIHDEMGIENLVELQAAAWDGRLAKLPGMGQKRIRAVRESLAARGRGSVEQRKLFPENEMLDAEIPVSELLDVDQEYRDKASRGKLPRIAPLRNNPTAEKWLPILHAERGDRHYTALYSNTAHAHQMGTTRDWVVIYLEDHRRDGDHGRWTVITSTLGNLRGRRIVRGRETECRRYYEARIESSPGAESASVGDKKVTS